ncbi:unnamed protein product [Somion occarium]|uniref:Uncharacterized protein n=1 Tax=Somion occarium TaxID=3059160 RepID=A0ABP1EBC4_9APHY
MSTIPIRPSLCDVCHQRPKNAGHAFCSKTCAAQAATLCAQCHQKPKFGNFEYCGKHCAGQAQKTVKPQAQAPQLRVQAPTNPTNAIRNKGVLQPQKNSHALRVVAGTAPVAAATQQVPQVPQVQTQMRPSSTSWVKKAAAQIPSILTNNSSSKEPAGPQGVPVVCAIPGCEVPVHVDSNGVQISEYCSMSHREEAVESGLVSPCVMCLTMPQSSTDYFCSRLCREEANHKSY